MDCLQLQILDVVLRGGSAVRITFPNIWNGEDPGAGGGSNQTTGNMLPEDA
jgi:hypothetical protein